MLLVPDRPDFTPSIRFRIPEFQIFAEIFQFPPPKRRSLGKNLGGALQATPLLAVWRFLLPEGRKQNSPGLGYSLFALRAIETRSRKMSKLHGAQASRRRKKKVENESVKAAIKAIGQMFANTVSAGRSFKNIPLAMIIM